MLVFLLGCQKEDEFIENPTTTNLSESDTDYGEYKEIYYQGFLVKHRFGTTEEELKEEHSLEYLKKLYNRLKNKSSKSTHAKSTYTEAELPGPNAILEASKVVLVNFPYEKIEGYNLVNLQLSNDLDVNMITTDFTNFTDQDIHPNNAVIDQYYSQNLDYLVLQEIANNPTIYDGLDNQNLARKNIFREFLIYVCSIAQATANNYGYVRGSIACVLAADRADTSSTNYYPNLDEANSRRDAYRHILWNSLLAQYYFTVSSKANRVGFATIIATAREAAICLGNNAEDSKEMDFHNNYIGRKNWGDNTTYRKVFGFIVGLRKPSTSQLKDYALHTVEKVSCLIVKTHPTNTSPSVNYSVEQTKQAI